MVYHCYTAYTTRTPSWSWPETEPLGWIMIFKIETQWAFCARLQYSKRIARKAMALPRWTKQPTPPLILDAGEHIPDNSVCYKWFLCKADQQRYPFFCRPCLFILNMWVGLGFLFYSIFSLFHQLYNDAAENERDLTSPSCSLGPTSCIPWCPLHFRWAILNKRS
jgi:hypothetical protein